MKLNELKNKKILILGFGKEGKDALRFLKKVFPKKKVAVVDKKQGKNYLKTIDKYDVVIKSPGIPVHLPEVARAYKKGKVTSPTAIFLANCKGRVVGVTGTKGKSTTVFWIYQMLKKNKLPVHLVGNIGKAALSHLLVAKPQDIFVYEMSSHQLYGLKISPQVAVLLNVYPEHLDYYRTFDEYAFAKANIARHQKKEDYFIYNLNDKTCRELAKMSRAKKIGIRGRYYELNRAAVRAVGRIFGCRELTHFKSLPHRLEFVGEFKKIKFYNDSLSTIPESTLMAMEFLGKDVQTLILGGFDRGQNFKDLAKGLLNSKIKNVLLFPPSGKRIWRVLEEQIGSQRELFARHYFLDNMVDAVRLAYRYTDKGKICLLSPASPSFGVFKDYRERGDLFKKYVRHFGLGR